MTRRNFVKRGALWLPAAASLVRPPAASAATLVTSEFIYAGTSTALNTTGATLLVAYMMKGSAAPSGPTDNQSNVWSPLTLITHGSVYTRFYYCANPVTSASHTFTAAASTGGCIAAFSGASAHDSGGTATDYGRGAAAATQALNAMTPTATGCLVVTGFTNFFNDPSSSVADNDADSDPVILAGSYVGAGLTHRLAWKNLNAASVTISWTSAQTATGSAMSQAAFLPPGGGGSTPTRRRRVIG